MDRGLGSSCRPHDESGALLDLALQASGAGHWSWDLGAQHGYWSDEVFRMFGERPAPDGGPVSREVFREAIHPEDLPHTQARFAAAFAERKDFLAEYRIRRSDGAIRWIRSRGRVVADGAGRPHMVGVSLDVTPEKLQEARLRASEERFRAAVECSLDAVGIYSAVRDASGAIVDFRTDYVNAAACELHRMPFEAQVGRTLRELYPAKRAARGIEKYARVVETGEPLFNEALHYEDENDDPDGRLQRAYDVRVVRMGDGFMATWRDITNRVQNEQEVRETKEMLQSLIDNSAASIFVKDEGGRFLLANPRVQANFGLPESQILGKTDHELVPPAVADAFRQNDLEVLRSERVLQREEEMVVDGKVHTFLSLKFPLRDHHGKPYAVCGVSTDITDRKRAEEALRESELRFRNMADTAPVMIWVTEADTACTFLNQRWYDFTGQTPERALGHGWLDALHPDDREEILRKFLAASRLRESTRFEYRLRRKDGEYRWALDSATPRFGPRGDFRGYVGSVVDISERKQLEDGLRESEERARARAQEIEAMMDATPAAIWIAHDPQCHVITGSRTAYEMMRVPLTQANISKTGAEGDTVPHMRIFRDGKELRPEDLPIQQAARGEPARDWEEEIVFDDGDSITIFGSAVPLRGPNGELRGSIGAFVDITAFKRTEAALHSERQRTEEALRAADRRKDEFMAMLSHELRNPLATIRNAVGVLRCTRTGNARIERLHDMIDRQSEQLTRMVDDLLDVARITQGKLILRKERVDLAAIVSRAVETSRPLIDAAGHALSIRMPAGSVMLEGDVGRLSQVLSNLLNNAAKYTETRGQIRLSAEVEGDEVQIRVEDNGIGIPPDVLPHVFDLFTQSSRAIDRAQGGLGIGLTLVRTLVEMHGGKVSARSGGTGQGAEFAVRLPIRRNTPADDLPAPTSEERGLMRRGEHRRILVVDDNIDAAESMALMLGYLGHETRMAHDGPSTLQIAATFQPELVLLDIGLPGLDGYEVARRLRAQRETQAAVLVAITGYGQEEDRKRARRAGFDHHLTKPVDHDRLISLIDTMVTPVDVPA
ncbi:PAS domain S-box protein [Polyangium sp. y55x31]|uniref:PAS domain S-box protein n=1 Tax=Polyangium sp. y55x31 TaxID=3042688 RepID=UPI002482E5C6|nr:PAS domain S-box protein [Polyangium sp. y55x31]MDI1481297.1 PAS domain S-box protein [Polyangium sp. y55x31]